MREGGYDLNEQVSDAPGYGNDPEECCWTPWDGCCMPGPHETQPVLNRPPEPTPTPWTPEPPDPRSDSFGNDVPPDARPESVIVRAEALHVVEAARVLVRNARMIADPNTDGATDCFAVPLGDVEALRVHLRNLGVL